MMHKKTDRNLIFLTKFRRLTPALPTRKIETETCDMSQSLTFHQDNNILKNIIIKVYYCLYFFGKIVLYTNNFIWKENFMQLLTIENINKRIKKQKILKDISFTLKQGEVVGLVGANGAGKTTLMKVILGLSNYQSGSLKLHGPMNNNHIGALIENPGVYPFLTGYENMNLINEDKEKENMEQIIKKLEMSQFIHKKAKAYSLGMKQKLGIALSLLNQPQLVILDEPMNGLDPKAVRNVRETILSLKAQGVSFLISSHMLGELVKVTDSILIIDNGAIVKETTMEELNNSNESDLENVLLNIIDHKEEKK